MEQFEKRKNTARLGLDDFEKGSVREDEGKLAGMHSENLYDENEDGAGEKYNLATGEAFDNSTYRKTDGLTEVEEEILDNTNAGVEDEEDPDVLMARLGEMSEKERTTFLEKYGK